ncbi:hypothetical protein ACIBI3_00365 [Actinomadura luteofluorescens]|uniref:hypothetical protein n=1 Tax=Actinomadura luteofluorescens TaxID=46163 RepID=UPI00346ED7D3
MAGGAVWVGTVSVLLRRAAGGRSVRRLLVLGGLLIGGWLLGCAAQSAHADERPPPAPVAGVVEKTPLLGDAVQTVREHRPVREAPGVTDPVEVVRVVAPEPHAQKVAQDVPPPRPEVRGEPVIEPAPRPVVTEAAALEPHHRPSAPAVSSLSMTRPSVGHAARHVVVRHHPAPMPPPEKPGTHSATGGFIMTGVAAGFPTAGTWVPAPHRASLRPAFGAVPPAVRTAADEPSFAPD